ncbi:non-heme iron oxygenase ferredoxin subunit [Actinomadura graeca]|uniref:Non-heme iron oxygenase ferredoxin subunit n=1 Tax=Actinomadura graeca TaxID=2750812 RepID=A0ABX8QR32_9ACTN|nr:non-heme iron oxygenase ferredoxin subunit [Actinomadura graeca]QXJ21151.1 non-heme iron oxygenase ferredoxin subunit [Actinomadura graeca]
MTDDPGRVVARSDEIADGEMLDVRVEGLDIALYRVGGRLYATAGICTHGRAMLTDGWLEDGVIECPLHGGRFEVRDGSCLGPPVDEPLTTYPVTEHDGEIRVTTRTEAQP